METERKAREALTRAVDRLQVASERQGFFDGWRSSKEDADGQLFNDSVGRMHEALGARSAVRVHMQLYAEAVRRAAKPSRKGR